MTRTGDRVQISPGYGTGHLSSDTMDALLCELWESRRYQRLLQVQREKPECGDTCTQEYQFEKPLHGFTAEVLACRKCKQIVVNIVRSPAA